MAGLNQTVALKIGALSLVSFKSLTQIFDNLCANLVRLARQTGKYVREWFISVLGCLQGEGTSPHLLVRVQRAGHDVQDLPRLGLEAELLGLPLHSLRVLQLLCLLLWLGRLHRTVGIVLGSVVAWLSTPNPFRDHSDASGGAVNIHSKLKPSDTHFALMDKPINPKKNGQALCNSCCPKGWGLVNR